MHIPQNFLPRSRQKLLRSAPGQSFPAVAVMPLAAKVLKQVMVNTGGNKRQVPAKRQNDVVISRLEKQAHWGCGLHYEIYEANLFDMAMNHLSRLPLKDRPVFIGAAARRGLFLAMEETRLAREAKDALMAELALEY